MDCKHRFQGHKDGVTCLLCGLRMTPEEYAEYLYPSTPEEPENIPDAPEEPEEALAGEPQTEPAPKKPRASRKKREATTDE